MAAMKVLIVDDDEMVIMVLERILSRDPLFKTVSASTGKEAMNILRHFPFDALICDMALPDTTGEDLLARINKEGRCPPFVMMMSGIVRPMASHPSTDFVFLEKPFSPEKVIAALQQAWRKQNRKKPAK
jgi:DNA-binding NtrC family response regulator